jgi:hypothetical protein
MPDDESGPGDESPGDASAPRPVRPGQAEFDQGEPASPAAVTAKSDQADAPPGADSSAPLCAPAGANPNDRVMLPEWRSHKIVEADRIASIETGDVVGPWDSGLRWHLAGGGVIVVSNGLVARGKPVVGDYFVRYDKGQYESWSPAQPFEDGYSEDFNEVKKAEQEAAGTGLQIKEEDDGNLLVSGTRDGEPLDPVTVPAGHRMADVVREQLHSMMNDLRETFMHRDPNAPDQPAPAAVKVAAEPARTGRFQAVPDPRRTLPPGVPPTPDQARRMPPVAPPRADGKPGGGRPESLR